MTKYVCVMFPYPSGNGLHIGHYYNYAIIDSYCRVLERGGDDIFQPFGYDAFGLPAENYARKEGREPADVTAENIDTFRSQMQRMNTGYVEKFSTTDPSYMKWTQWLFLKLVEHDMAYKAEGDVNYCGSCDTVLANEQVKGGRCERCSHQVSVKKLVQWFFRTTAYKDRLLKNLDWIDYPEKTKKAQREWILNSTGTAGQQEPGLKDWCVSRQRKWGCPIPIEGEADTLDTFVDSSFYYVRYCDPFNDNELCSKEAYKPVDIYVGGNEHACMHLIYARFIHMFLFDIGVVPTEEPFRKVVHQGMILKDQQKMSKSLGNVVSPDGYDPDALRLYLMFIGPYFEGGSWSDQNFVGIERFIKRLSEWLGRTGSDRVDVESFATETYTLAKSFKFNRVVSTMMMFVNEHRTKNLDVDCRQAILDVVENFAPGIRNKITV
jgi:leucyl-tRNA synthetase